MSPFFQQSEIGRGPVGLFAWGREKVERGIKWGYKRGGGDVKEEGRG